MAVIFVAGEVVLGVLQRLHEAVVAVGQHPLVAPSAVSANESGRADQARLPVTVLTRFVVL